MSIVRDRHADLHAPKQDEIVLLQLCTDCSLSFLPAAKALETLTELGIARESNGGQRNRLFAYDAYLAILSEGAEPL
jgi:hypothetical protein